MLYAHAYGNGMAEDKIYLPSKYKHFIGNNIIKDPY